MEATVLRVRQEVAKRKGAAVAEIPPDLASAFEPRNKNPLQKASNAVDRAKTKHEKAQRWPKLLRPLRRNQESINHELIGAVAILADEVQRLQRLVLPLGAQHANLCAQQETQSRKNREFADQMESLEEMLFRATERLSEAPASPRTDSFYQAFEDRFRGSRALIKERLLEYLPFLRALKEKIPAINAVDVGCGRGEWLELLKENGVSARGVDLNAGLVEQCRALGLEAMQGDAVACLKGLPEASLALVSGFHVVEHLPLPLLLSLFQESLRVLRPGGIAIFETPNPECPRVSSYTFHLDPTRRNPIPYELLSFIGTQAGFSSVQMERLHPFCEEGFLKGYGDYAGIFTK